MNVHSASTESEVTAKAKDSGTEVCEDCGGAGQVGEEHYMGDFQPPERELCPNCHGAGYIKQMP